jgi:hypothetical protein
MSIPCRRADSRKADVGSVTLGLAVVFPVILLLIVTVIQAALVWHAHDLVVTAAHEGLDSARLDGGTPAEAEQQARAMLDRVSGKLLDSVSVDVSTTATQVLVHVHATVIGPLPGVHMPVDAIVAGPRERFVPDTGSSR